MTETGINTVVTIASILVSLACAIYSCVQAKKAKLYKKETQSLMHLFDLLKYSERFHRELNRFIDDSRGVNWNKGRSLKDILGRLSKLIQDMNLILPKMEQCNEVKVIDQECNALKTLLYNEISFAVEDKAIIIKKIDMVDRMLSQYVEKTSGKGNLTI